MAGLLAWAADVVGGGGGSHVNDRDEDSSIPLVFTPDQQKYVQELDQKAASLSRTIQDLRLRIPPPDISQRLPHLHAHSLASNAALALQLNAHSATREQVGVLNCLRDPGKLIGLSAKLSIRNRKIQVFSHVIPEFGYLLIYLQTRKSN